MLEVWVEVEGPEALVWRVPQGLSSRPEKQPVEWASPVAAVPSRCRIGSTQAGPLLAGAERPLDHNSNQGSGIEAWARSASHCAQWQSFD